MVSVLELLENVESIGLNQKLDEHILEPDFLHWLLEGGIG